MGSWVERRPVVGLAGVHAYEGCTVSLALRSVRGGRKGGWTGPARSYLVPTPLQFVDNRLRRPGRADTWQRGESFEDAHGFALWNFSTTRPKGGSASVTVPSRANSNESAFTLCET